MEERRFTGVEVFWLTRADNAAAERDALALHIVDGKHGAVEEAILRAKLLRLLTATFASTISASLNPSEERCVTNRRFPAQTPSSTFSARSLPDRVRKDSRALPALRMKDRA